MKTIQRILRYLLWVCRLIAAALLVLMIVGTIFHVKENLKRNGTLTYLR